MAVDALDNYYDHSTATAATTLYRNPRARPYAPMIYIAFRM